MFQLASIITRISVHVPKAISDHNMMPNSSLIMLVVRQTKPVGGSRRFFSAQQSVIRKHVTSSRHSAEATLVSASTVTLDSKNVDSKSKILSKHPSLPPNIVHSVCPLSTVATIDGHEINPKLVEENAVEATSPRPLLILFAWMLAKNQHIEKYRQFWFERGYDVLSIQTSPMALLLPGVGGKRNAENVLDFLVSHQPRYDEILVHAFSVGGYQLCEVLYILEQMVSGNDPNQKKIAEQIYKSMKGWIVDSCVFAQDAAPGLSRAITLNKITQPILEKSIESFLYLTKPFTMDRYIRVESKLKANRTKIPGLLLYSKDDLVSSEQTNRNMHHNWKANGTLTDSICWDKSIHVLHYKEHQNEYQEKVDEFVSKLDITKA